MSRRSALAKLLMLALHVGLLAQASDLAVSGHGLIFAVVRPSTPASGGYQFLIQRRDQTEPDVRFTLSIGSANVETLRIHDSRTVSVVGQSVDGAHSLAVVDATNGDLLVSKSCRALRLVRENTRFWCEDERGKLTTYEIATRTERPVLGSAEGARTILQSGSLHARRRFVKTFDGSKSLRQNADVRLAIREALSRALHLDIARANDPPAVNGLRTGSAERDYFGELISAAAHMSDLASLPSIVRADHPSVAGAVAWFGPDAIEATLAALRRPVPTGYSMYYRAYLLEGLSIILRRDRRISTGNRSQIAHIAVISTERPQSSEEVLRAIDLIEELDDETLDPTIQRLAHDPHHIRRTGITDARAVAQIQERARAVLSGQIIIR